MVENLPFQANGEAIFESRGDPQYDVVVVGAGDPRKASL
jgi:hypothetical protein